ncbi:MAG: Stp1/IreP family PP2C-type Ser/Thr phosphatase [bacterium]|nr:Stp1/IreP family PP2C-type Ser/Thr phosphatase [bacterium]
MKTFYLTDAGKVRTHNEDKGTIISNDKNQYLLAIADGMGGHKAGEVASSLAIDYLTLEFNKQPNISDKNDAINWLRRMVNEINEKIFNYTAANPENKGMGTTLVIALKTDDYVLFGNIGDSSGFVIKNDKLHKVTKDHTLVNLLVSTGELTVEEAKFHPRKNVLMRALGANNPIEIDIFDVDTSIKGILLCSDGLTNMLTVEQIEKVLFSHLAIDEAVIKLIRKSNSRGGTDNISIAYLTKESGDL